LIRNVEHCIHTVIVHTNSKSVYDVKNASKWYTYRYIPDGYLLFNGSMKLFWHFESWWFLNASSLIIINNRGSLYYTIHACIYVYLSFIYFFLSRKENVLMTSTLYQTRSIDAHQLQPSIIFLFHFFSRLLIVCRSLSDTLMAHANLLDH